ncbi:hypothetical protein D3C83_55830 [compost metagenome]
MFWVSLRSGITDQLKLTAARLARVLREPVAAKRICRRAGPPSIDSVTSGPRNSE